MDWINATLDGGDQKIATILRIEPETIQSNVQILVPSEGALGSQATIRSTPRIE